MHLSLKKISAFYFNLRLRTKLIISYLILIIIPSFSIGFVYYNISSQNILEIAEENILDIVTKNNQIMDQKLSAIVDSVRVMNIDADLFNLFENMDTYSDYDILQVDKKITKILYKYFPQSEDIFSTNIITSRLTFGNSSMIVPAVAFFNSDLYAEAKAAKGNIKWVPTYSFTKMLKLEDWSNESLDYSYIFSAVQLLNPTYIDDYGNEMRITSQNVERPVTIISFKPEIYEQVFSKSLSIPKSFYCISTKDGRIISHTDSSYLAQVKDLPWIDAAQKSKRGTLIAEIDSKRYVVCYDTAKVTGWVSAIIVPVDQLLLKLSDLRYLTFIFGVFLVIIAILLAYFIAKTITKPITKLIAAIKRVGDGHFNTKIYLSHNDEVGYLAKKFNEMDDKIQSLIEENYKSKLREKDTEIMALNIQLNPHFLYNTLNIINLTAIENNQKEVSKMLVSVSSMLQYTSRNKQELTPFQEDFEWLQNYIYIMSLRFEGKFEVIYDIEPQLFQHKVPKLFLQPFIENAIIHGFELISDGGEIKISGWIEKDLRYFSIKDNGVGMRKEKIQEVMNSNTDSIGISNVNNRIRLIYGKDYGVGVESYVGSGTRIKITMPLESKDNPTL